MTEPTVQELAGGLDEADAEGRLQAARDLLERARHNDNMYLARPALAGALEDSDDRVRRTAALTLVTDRWNYCGLKHAVPLLLRDLESEDEVIRGEAVDALMEAARRFDDHVRSGVPVIPVLIRALAEPDPEARLAALVALRQLADYRQDISEAMPALARLLAEGADEEVIAAAQDLWFIALVRGEGAIDLGPVEQLLESPSAEHRYGAAKVLALYAVRGGDADAIGRLVGDADAAIREGAVAGLLAAADRGLDVEAGVPALAGALGDSAGGVVHGAVRALVRAAYRGADLGPVLDDLKRAVEKITYSRDGWTFVVDPIQSSDLKAEDAKVDLAMAIATHHINQRDWPAVEVQIGDDTPGMRAGAYGALRSTAERDEDDEPARRAIEGLLARFED